MLLSVTAAKRLRAEGPPPGRGYWLEGDLERFMYEAAKAKTRTVADACRNFTVPIPGWWPGAGRVDLMVEAKSNESARCDLYELKWCNDDKVEEAMWDAVKMACAHEIRQVRNTYLVFGAPAKIWAKPPVGHELFDAGRINLEDLLHKHAKRWKAVLGGGKGRPISSVDQVAVKPVVSCPVVTAGGEFEVKAVCLTPVGSNTFDPSDSALI